MDSKKSFSISDYYIPIWFLVLITIGSVVSLVLIPNFILATVLLAVCGALWTTKCYTSIDLNEHVFSDYLFFAGVKLNNTTIKFKELNRIFITKEKITHAYRSRGSFRDASWMEYTAQLIFDGSKTVPLWTDTDREECIAKAKKLAKVCSIDLEMRTQENWYLINLD
ncbi:MAG: hypothetical protein ACKOE5_09440 [Cytophagales bacterium]